MTERTGYRTYRSFTQLSQYLECGECYRLKYVERVREAPSVWTVGGTAFHSCAEWYLRGDLTATPDAERMINAWEIAWQLAHADVVKRLPDDVDPDPETWRAARRGAEGPGWWRAHGWRMLSDFAAWWSRSGLTVYEIPSEGEGVRDACLHGDDGDAKLVANWLAGPGARPTAAEGERWLRATREQSRFYEPVGTIARPKPALECELLVDLGGVPVRVIPDALVVDEHGQLDVLDYKSSRAEKVKRQDPYQLAVYAAGVEVALGIRPTWGLYYGTRLAEAYPHDLSRIPLAQIEDDFARFDANELAGIYKQNPGRHLGLCQQKEK